ncbi:MAG: hypothetical protein BEU05_03390 [Marine Group III euryarchaeote CG-Bathy2]|uniref:Cytochrome C oxidase subunit IV family protein n=3 Tax=Methanobacteriati TaxID=3366610 RepID=A0A075H6J2_9EURY|nr:hypothetical protein [uncultured marine group II/III euryarchaeote KM3_164_G07]AIF09528.1 hypothetical protein [uncultured marine group II/III euryarchaeote KM3_37_D11]OIR11977.1 MAG: hypothetical protein BEU05_03390 [Marine Group III euryarchaeote CG-Bathy2]
MSNDENPDTDAPEEAHDDHEEHEFPSYANGFMAVFGWLVFFTIIEVLAILQEFSFNATMFILFSIAFVKVWFIASFFMHLRWDPPLATRTAGVPIFFLIVLFGAIGLTSPGSVDDIRTICGF